MEFDLAASTLSINGVPKAFDDAAVVRNGNLLVRLDWLATYIDFKVKANEQLNRLELMYIRTETNGLFHNDTLPNAKPVAKFATNKETYRIGEPIAYTDLSYDPDMDGITAEWVGNADVIYEPMDYNISLTVTDSKGNVSDTYSRIISVINEPYLTHFDYQIHHEPVGTYVLYDEPTLRQNLRGIPQLPVKVENPKDRPLIVSDSPETFYDKGFLYQESINGKARLYADHVNGTKQQVQFAILMRNPSPNKTVTVTTTNQGEVYPSIYANLIGNEASLQFLLQEMKPETLSIGPGQTVYYRKMPNFYPDQGMNVMYDVESDGEVYVSFVAMDPNGDIPSVGMFKQQEYTGNVRGTFEWSQVKWEIDAKALKVPSSIALGDGISDKFVTGTDFFTKQESLNLGNYGVVYNIHIDQPAKMAVLILPRGGVFKGPFLVNGKIVQSPASGVMTDYSGYTIIARTDGTEKELTIDFTPAAGSAFPIDIIFYPL
jgi:hypothetical protein